MPEVQQCCIDKVTLRAGEASDCCDRKTYSRDLHVCCNGVISELTAFNSRFNIINLANLSQSL